MANEGLGKTSTILNITDAATTYTAGQTTVLSTRGARHLVLYFTVAQINTSVEVRVQTSRDGGTTYRPRFEKSVTANGSYRFLVRDLAASENKVQVAVKGTGGTTADVVVKARFDSIAVPLLT
jgi:hypothetical protein